MTDMHDAHRLDDHELLALLHTLVVQSNQTEAQLLLRHQVPSGITSTLPR
jgi:hypothetical protein